MQSIEIELKKAIQQAIQKSFDLEVSLEQIAIEIPKNKDHGDFPVMLRCSWQER